MPIRSILATRLGACALFSALSVGAFGSEIDNFAAWTQRFELKDSQSALDAEIRRQWDLALADVAPYGCDERRLYKTLMKRFGNHVKTEMGKWLYETDALDVHNIDRKKSIYATLKLKDSLILSDFLSKLSDSLNLDIGMGKLIRHGSHYIGIDKLEHFWATGGSYFTLKSLKKKGSLEDALAYGESMENGILGAKATGVYSFGDLAANFDGMRFWNHVLLKEDDVLGSAYNLGPYVVCKNDTWKTLQYPDLNDYVAASWSEANNCSNFKSQAMLKKVETELEGLRRRSKDQSILNCPIEAGAIQALRKKYSPQSYPELHRRLLNPRFGVVRRR